MTTETADWKPGTITRSHQPGKDPLPPVDGWVRGSFGVFQDASSDSWRNGLWNLTHVPSGCRLCFYDEQQDAFAAVGRLEALPVDWATIDAQDGTKKLPKKTVAAIKAAIAPKRSIRL